MWRCYGCHRVMPSQFPSRCEPCAEVFAAYKRTTYLRDARIGRCHKCSEPAEAGSTRCHRHNEVHRKHQRERAKQLSEQGLCCICGRNPRDGETKRCTECKAKRKGKVAEVLKPELLTRDQSRSRRKHPTRKRSIQTRFLTKYHLRIVQAELDAEERILGPLPPRPKTRGECRYGIRPCPWLACKWHLYLDVTRKGAITFNFPDLEPSQLKESCALDVADRGAHRLESVGEFLNLTRERIRQIEMRARETLTEQPEMVEFDDREAS